MMSTRPGMTSSPISSCVLLIISRSVTRRSAADAFAPAASSMSVALTTLDVSIGLENLCLKFPIVPNAFGETKSIIEYNSSRLFCMGVPVSKSLCWAGVLLL